MTAIFKHSRQAIAFAYLVEGMPAKQDSPLGQAVRKAIRESGQEEIIAPEERGTIDLSGMTDLEVRGQCAMIRLAVESTIPKPEGWAIKARYGHTHIHTNPDKSRQFFFEESRLASIRHLTEYVRPLIPNLSQSALMLLVMRYCAGNEQLQPSLRLIEKEGGSSKSTLGRADKRLRGHIRSLIDLGVGRLEPLFIEHGLIEDPALDAVLHSIDLR